MLDGKVLLMTYPLHRHQEWLKLLKMIDRKTSKTNELHLVVDNYATHKHPEVKAWLAKHPRFHIHFTPTSSSWLNMVERGPFATSQINAFVVAPLTAWPNWRPPSTNISLCITPDRSRLSGQQRPATS
ncbi:hypothetical protein NTG1052_230007 [Candidatus Nitrotoga sp. 1052]|nr:hypothetical protein NTG1052_230007 [Candidatus Nitrotoga sp. 1052]